MLKMYQVRSEAGGSAEFWEQNWAEDRLEDAIRFCAIDPLRPLIERHAPAGSRMLEGGCGQGQYVVFHVDRGVRVVGLDFALDTLVRLRGFRRDLELCAGDVGDLPFRTAAFDVYYSGGVVEHFEGGPEPALREAHRVLRPGGTLLVSVPYFSPLRRVLRPFHRDLWRRLPSAAIDALGPGTPRRFWQYAYTQEEFSGILERVGFRVVARQGYSILWGLYDLPLIARLVAASRPSASPGPPPPDPPGRASVRQTDIHGPTAAASSPPRPSLLKRLVVGEDPSVPVAGWIVRALRSTAANMMMYVAVR